MLGAELALRGHRVALIDRDQGQHLSRIFEFYPPGVAGLSGPSAKSLRGLRQQREASAAVRMMTTPTTPDEGVLVRVPVGRRLEHRLFNLSPGLEATTFQRQRAQDLPPRLDQVQVGRVLGLEDELPAGVCLTSIVLALARE